MKNLSCAIITPANYCSKIEILKIKKNVQRAGFKKIEEFTSTKRFFGLWAGSPDEKLKNLYDAWNSDSAAIICCKGGSGVSHFVPLIDIKNLKKRKIIIGYSDMTILLNYLSEKLKIITLHGPNGFKRLDKKSLSAMRNAMQMKDYGIQFTSKQILNKSFNEINGKLIGGNLERLMEYSIYSGLDVKDKILFLEEIEEKEHRIFSVLNILKKRWDFRPKAILFGDLGIKKKDKMRRMIHYLFPDIPIILDLPFGHNLPNITIPIGAECKINFVRQKIDFIFPEKDKEYAVKF